jgi:hydrogenase expression/formation protein HypD
MGQEKQQFTKEILQKINKVAGEIKKDVNLMEVCGTHTQAVARAGIRALMPKNVGLTTGPGCPVCVTAQEDIDAIVNLALAGVPVATYGDMLRVPGYYGSLDDARAKGARVFSVYSTEQAVELLKDYPDLVFFGLGFETTTPMTAWAIKHASLASGGGFSVYSTHKLFLPAMEALLAMGEAKINGFIAPGHVSTIIGVEPYRHMQVPQVITGFEPDDVLMGVYMLLCQIKEGRSEVENEYTRSVKEKGNPEASKLIFDVFEPSDGNWRGFGIIPNSGLKIKDKYKKFDAKVKYREVLSSQYVGSQTEKQNKLGGQDAKFKACKCGEIIRGLKTPQQCPLFKRSCTPDKPNGPCMVSVEGACNVAYRYDK